MICFFFLFFYCSLAIYILTKSLIPLLEKSADPRVVSLTIPSLSHYSLLVVSKLLLTPNRLIAALVNVIHHFNEHLMGLDRGYFMV